MAKTILIKPLITEKSDHLAQSASKYTFVVNRRANKIEIGKAVESTYNVSVTDVNTLVMPGKSKTKMTKTGVQRGKTSSFKKAIVTLIEGDTIDFYDDL